MSIEARLRDALDRMADEIKPRSHAWAALDAGIRGNRRARLAAGLLTVAVLATGAMLVVPRLGSEPASDVLYPARPASFKLVHRATIHLSDCGGPAVGCGRPFVYNVAIGFGSAWINTGRGLLRIDLATNAVTRLDAAAMGVDAADFSTALEDVAVGPDGVWIWHTTSRRVEAVSRIDPATNRRVATIALPRGPRFDGHGDRSVVVGEGSVWATVGGNRLDPPLAVGEMARIDPRTNLVSGSFSANVRLMAVGEGAAWYVDEIRGLIRVDPEGLTGEPAGTPPDAVGIAAGAGAVWLTTGDPHDKGKGSLIKVDAKTNRVVDTIHLSAGGPIVVGEGAVWFIDFANGAELTWLDPANDRIVDRISVPTLGPVDLAVGDQRVWVTSMNDGIAYRYDIQAR